jgi:membrane-associated phospholipid phosphatase
VAIVFSSLIPYGVIWLGVRRGTLTDHHIGRREQRRAPLVAGLASVLVGLVALIVLNGPRELVAMVVVMLVVLFGTAVVNQFWKLSAHTAVSGGSVAVLVVLFGSPMVAAALLVTLIGWSRVVLRDHTTAQVLTGAGVGAVLASICFLLMT